MGKSMNIYESGWYDAESKARMDFLADFLFKTRPLTEYYPSKHKRLLDIGCYKGYLSVSVDSKAIAYYGLDMKNYGIKASWVLKNFKVQNLNENRKLPYPSKYFDYIVASGVLEHIFYPVEVLKEIKRILKDDGTLVVSLLNEKSLLVRINTLMGKDPPSIEAQETKHHWMFTPKVAVQWMSKYFKIVDVNPYIGLWGRRFTPWILVRNFPNLFCSDYFIKCVK